jgi:hypothetical protein
MVKPRTFEARLKLKNKPFLCIFVIAIIFLYKIQSSKQSPPPRLKQAIPSRLQFCDLVNYEFKYDDLHLLHVKRNETTLTSRTFRKFIGFDTASMDQKVEHWQKEYNYRIQRSKKDGMHVGILQYARLLSNGAVFVDSGAHLGDTSLPVLDQLHIEGRTDIKLVLVEPDRSKCVWLLFCIRTRYPNLASSIAVVQAGLWSHNTRASLIRNKMHAGAWTVQPDRVAIRNHKMHGGPKPPRGEIRLLPLSEIVGKCHSIELIHLDVEKCELRALMGMDNLGTPIIIYENMGETDKFLVSDYLQLGHGYRLVDRIPPNNDRVMMPERLSMLLPALPYYV